MRLISDFKSGSGDPAGSGEGDPTDPTAAIVAALRSFDLTQEKNP